MSKLTRDDVLKLARLSRLKLSEEEVEKFRSELSEILQYVEVLDGVDVGDLQPTYQVSGLVSAMRQDEIIDYGVSASELLKSAPALEGNQYKVKRVL